MSFSADDKKALLADINAISAKNKSLTKSTMRALVTLVDNLSDHPSDDISIFLRQWISDVQLHEKTTKVSHPISPILASVYNENTH